MRSSLYMTLALALLLSGSAGAQGDEAEAARAAFSNGNYEFKLGHWLAAASAWERGYKIKADPVFLYNIAQAYRQADVADKALFFYRGYLRAAPEAANRAQVEEHVAQLEELLSQRANGTATTAAATTTAATTTGSVPPPSDARGKTAIATAPSSSPPTSSSPPSIDRARRIDLEAGLGLALWAAGVPSGTSPSLAVTLGGGYTVLRGARLELRIGGLVGYTYLRDVATTDHFLSLLVDPMLRARLYRQRLFLDGELGLGAQIVAGLTAGSPLLPAKASGGTAAAFALRPALSLEARLARPFALRAGVALSYSPVGMLASPSLVRVELMLAAILRL